MKLSFYQKRKKEEGKCEMDRLTYKALSGGYGTNKSYDSNMEEIYTLRNALGKYEDIGLTPEEIKQALFSKNRGEKMYEE